jgi:hypothetical protein
VCEKELAEVERVMGLEKMREKNNDTPLRISIHCNGRTIIFCGCSFIF